MIETGGRTISRKTAITQKPPTTTPDRALKALTRQLDALQKLKNRSYQEVEADEAGWKQMTQSFIEAAFGDPSPSLERFRMVGMAGLYHTTGLSPQQRQSNVESLLREHEDLLRSLISVLQLQLPEEKIKGVYEPGDQYGFYRDLSSLIESAIQDLLIIDAYLNEKVFNLYVEKVPAGVTVRILSNKISANVETVARMYATSKPLELRSSAGIHDRVVLIDQRGWLIGQSIKDAARKKPTYLIELDEPSLSATRDIHNRIWAAATVVNLAS